jgi:hypothetical protein
MESSFSLRLTFFVIFMLLSCAASGQPQLVLLRGEQVLIRKEVGDVIRYKLRKSDKSTESFITAVWEFGFISNADSVRFMEVEKIHAGDRSSFLSRLGRAMIVGGAGYFLLDQFNEGIISGNGFSLEESVWRPAVALVMTGGVLSVSGRKWYRTGYGPFRVMTVESDSPFYRVID